MMEKQNIEEKNEIRKNGIKRKRKDSTSQRTTPGIQLDTSLHYFLDLRCLVSQHLLSGTNNPLIS